MSDVQFFDPAKLPYRGMKSALSGLSLDRGEWLLGENIRVGDRTIRSRWGLKKVGSSPAVNPTEAGSVCIGAKTVVANGTSYAMSAWTHSGGSIYVYTLNLTTGAWSQLNATSGKYGDTTGTGGLFHLGTVGYAFMDFHAVKDPRSGLDYVVCVGDKANGVYDPTNSTFALQSAINPPQDTSGFSSIPTFSDGTTVTYFTVNDEATTTLSTGTATRFTAADQGSAPENYIRFTRDTTASTDPTREMQFTTARDLSNCRQLVMLYDTKAVDLWERIKVEVSENGSDYTVVWDPTTSNYRYELIPAGRVQKDRQVTATETKAWVAFNLDHIPAASRNAVNRVRLTYKAAAPSSTLNFDIYVVAGSGKVIGNSYHALTYMDSASRVESQPVFPKVQPELVKNLGGATLNNLRIPFDERMFYTYTVGYQNLSAASQVNTVNIYRLDPGDIDPNRYSYVSAATISTYGGGSWSLSSGIALSILTYSDTTVSSSRNLKVLAPFPKCRPMPAGCLASIVLGPRMIMAKWSSSGGADTPTFSELWVSEHSNPWRYYEAPYGGDPLGGGMLQMSGEIIYGFAKNSTGGYGIDSLLTFTDRNVYRSVGPSVQGLLGLGTVCQHGTRYGGSIATNRDAVFWVDKNQDVIKLSSAGLQNLSRNVVHDKFSGLVATSPYAVNNNQPYKVSAVVFQNRYYCAVDTAGSDTYTSMTKTRVMVYDDIFDVWSMDTWANSLTTDLLFLADTKVYGIGNATQYAYKSEDGSTTTDDGTAYAMNLTTGTIHQDFQAGLEVTRCWVLMDDATSGTAAWTATYLPDGSTRGSGAKSVDVSGSYVLRELRAAGGTGKGSGVTASVAFVFTVPGGTRVYGISAEIQPVPIVPTAV